MANKHTVWQGGASKTAKVATNTIAGTWATSDTITTKLDDENGGQESVVTTVTGGSPTVENVVDQHLAELQAETTKTLFTRITWSKSGTDKVVATAVEAGVPFYVSGAETSTSGTVSWAATTANSGPNDLNTSGNWSNGVIADDDDVDILPHPTEKDVQGHPKSHQLLYGLNQSGIDLERLRIAEAFTAPVGDPVNGFYLMVDCDDNGGGTGKTIIRTSGYTTWIKGTHTDVTVRKIGNGGQDALRLDISCTNFRVLGAMVTGRIKFKDGGSGITNFYQNGAPGAHTIIGTGSGITILDVDSGQVETYQAVTTWTTGNTARIIHWTGAVTNMTTRGGLVLYNSSGNIGTTGSDGLDLRDGTLDFRQNKSQSDVSVYNAVIHAGNLIDEGGLANIVYPDNITKYGGNVSTETASVIAVS